MQLWNYLIMSIFKKTLKRLTFINHLLVGSSNLGSFSSTYYNSKIPVQYLYVFQIIIWPPILLCNLLLTVSIIHSPGCGERWWPVPGDGHHSGQVHHALQRATLPRWRHQRIQPAWYQRLCFQLQRLHATGEKDYGILYIAFWARNVKCSGACTNTAGAAATEYFWGDFW